MARRAEWWPRQQQDRRDERAAVWRQARARLFALPAERRRAIRALWRACPSPADPHSFAAFLHQIEVGTLDLARPGWRFHARVQHDRKCVVSRQRGSVRLYLGVPLTIK